MVTITTKYVSNASGRGGVLAKGGGKQRTIPWDHSKSDDRNHGEAAGTLALVLFQGATARRIAVKTATHEYHENGHTFHFSI